MNIVVFGLGYLGATHAACMAELGHDVLGVELDDARRESLAAGHLPFYEPELPELLTKHIDSGKLRVTDSYQEAADWGDVHFIAVGTPQRRGEYAADLKYVNAVVDGLVPLLQRDTVIFGKSTVPVGTCVRLQDRISELAKPDVRVHLGWNPEFLREGHAVVDTLRPDRLVLGVEEHGVEEHSSGTHDGTEPGPAERAARKIYAPLISDGVPFIVMSPASAEIVKVAANSFLATKISFINAIAEICEAAGAEGGGVWAPPPPPRPPTTASAASSSTPDWASAAVACPRTSGRSWPAPVNSVRPRHSRFCGRWTTSTCDAATASSTSPKPPAVAAS